MRKLLPLIALVPLKSWGWGATGHRVVAELAEQRVSPQTKAKLQMILKGKSLAKISNWADQVRSETDMHWHYMTWPSGKQNPEEGSRDKGYLLVALEEQLKLLQDPKKSLKDRARALRYFVHFVGDIHQPLHVGGASDKGGNDCQVIFQGKSTNLHRLWDEEMIDFSHLSFVELARFSSEGRSAVDIEKWRKGGFIDWARESQILREKIYPHPARTEYCPANGDPVPEAKKPALSYEYFHPSMRKIETRLFQAGIRLAYLLDQNLR